MIRPPRRRRPAAATLFTAVLSVTLLGTSAPSVARGACTPWVAYQSSLRGGQFGPDGIFLVHRDGSDDHEIATSLPGQHIHPDWSADGRALVFRADVGDYAQLFLMDPLTDPAGHRARQLTHCDTTCVQIDDPAVSPDGTHVAYVEDTGITVVGQLEVPTSFDLRVARISHHGLTDVRTLVHSHTDPTGPTELLQPRWSPDGTSLVFWSDHADPATGLVDGTVISTVHSDGTHRRALTAPSMYAGEVDWSPDGRRLVFDTDPLMIFNFDDVVSNLYTSRPDGTDVRQLTFAATSQARSTQPRWTPDGHILYTQVGPDGRTLWTRDANGSHPTPIAPGGLRTHGDLQPAPAGCH
jgi:Tol biopolymer transport system component